MKAKYTRQVNVLLTEEQYHKLKFLALLEGKPISVVVRDCIRLGLSVASISADLAFRQFLKEYVIPIMEHGATIKILEKEGENEEGGNQNNEGWR
ncbi:MAG: hypothetical protein QXN87_08980 [Candidatus Bathyarchaeia archaeon]